MKHQFTSVIEKRGKWHVAYVEELPGVNTQGRTLAEARHNLKDALKLIIAELRFPCPVRDEVQSPTSQRHPDPEAAFAPRTFRTAEISASGPSQASIE